MAKVKFGAHVAVMVDLAVMVELDPETQDISIAQEHPPQVHSGLMLVGIDLRDALFEEVRKLLVHNTLHAAVTATAPAGIARIVMAKPGDVTPPKAEQN